MAVSAAAIGSPDALNIGRPVQVKQASPVSIPQPEIQRSRHILNEEPGFDPSEKCTPPAWVSSDVLSAVSGAASGVFRGDAPAFASSRVCIMDPRELPISSSDTGLQPPARKAGSSRFLVEAEGK